MKILNKILFVLFLIYVFNNIGISQNFGGWIIIDSTIERRFYPASTILKNGNMLIAGGGIGDSSAITSKSSEIYDTTLKHWRFTNDMNFPREAHRLVSLPNGKVLVIGGLVKN